MKLMTERQDLRVQRRLGAPREENSLEERDHDGRHQRSLSGTGRNLNLLNAYGLFSKDSRFLLAHELTHVASDA